MPFRPESVVAHHDLFETDAGWERDARAGKQPAAAVWKGLQPSILRIKDDGQWGEVIASRQAPAYFRTRYGATNLYCVGLASFRRLLYTIFDKDAFLLDRADHARYDEWLHGPRRR
ncbi:hypothetical protein B1B_01062 [mine drainage metagenome]|uniref:Uncharacterized protein n=1 Tax=mine drainage metagenome TaxID=410659 RepID=T1C5Z3_9ZZZZ